RRLGLVGGLGLAAADLHLVPRHTRRVHVGRQPRVVLLEPGDQLIEPGLSQRRAVVVTLSTAPHPVPDRDVGRVERADGHRLADRSDAVVVTGLHHQGRVRDLVRVRRPAGGDGGGAALAGLAHGGARRGVVGGRAGGGGGGGEGG